MNPDELQNHPPIRPFDQQTLSYLDRAWDAAASANPSKLVDFLDDTEPTLPLLQSAFRQILWRYPDATTGLSLIDATLLTTVRDHGPSAASVIAKTMQRLENAGQLVGDGWLWSRAHQLARSPTHQQALELIGSASTIRGTEMRLTSVGERCLSGQSSYLDLSGINEWVGGVHLDSTRGNVWVLKEGRLIPKL